MQAVAYTYHIPYPGMYSAAAWPFYLPSMSAAYHHHHTAESLLPPAMPPNICSSSPPSPIAPRNLTLRPSSRTGRQGKTIFLCIFLLPSYKRSIIVIEWKKNDVVDYLMLFIHYLVLLLSLLSISWSFLFNLHSIVSDRAAAS